MNRSLIIVLAGWLLASPMCVQAQSDRPAKTSTDVAGDAQSVSPRRGLPIVEAAIAEAKARLERLESLRQSLEDGQQVSRGKFHEAMSSGQEARGNPGRPGMRDEPMGMRPWPEGRQRSRDGQEAGDPQWRLAWSELDAAHKKRVREFLREHAPQAARRIEHADGPVADRILSRVIAPRAMRVLAAEDENPRLGELALDDFKAGVELFSAGRGLRDAFVNDGEESDEFTEALAAYRSAIEHEMDAKLGMRLYEFELLETRLAEQRSALGAEQTRREDRIERSMEQVLGRLRRALSGARGERGRADRPGRAGEPRRHDGSRPRGERKPGPR